MYKSIGNFLSVAKNYVWAIIIIFTVLMFVYGVYIKINETLPTKVYALEISDVKQEQKLTDLEISHTVLTRDLLVLQSTLQEVKSQLSENQKETRTSLNEINRDIKYILKSI